MLMDQVPLLQRALGVARDRIPESNQPGVVRSYNFCVNNAGFRDEILTSLNKARKSIFWQALFDTNGLRLFERVCAQPEYLGARTEKNIISANLGEIVEFIGANSQYIDLGQHGLSGARYLLERLRPSIYIPVDASKATLEERAGWFAQQFPWLNICSVQAEFTQPLHLPRFVGAPLQLKAVFLLGGAFARFAPDEARALLVRLRALAGRGGRILVTVDQTADWQILQGAYNDQRGAMEAFNANALAHINRELRSDFQIHRFRHCVGYDAKENFLEMSLESRYAQFANVAGTRINFVAGEKILTAIHCTYGDRAFRELAHGSGLRLEKTWNDTHNLFAVHGMVAV